MRWKGAAVLLILLSAIAPSMLDAYVIFSRPEALLFSRCDRNAADWIKDNTSRSSVFLTSDDIIHYVPSLAGRRVVDGSYTWNTGFRTPGMETDIRRIYSTGLHDLIEKYHINYIMIGPQERRRYAVREKAFDAYTTVYQRHCNGNAYRIVDAASYQPVETATNYARASQQLHGRKKTFLSDITPVQSRQDFKALQRDKNINGNAIMLNGMRYEKGLGAHARSEILYDLQRQYSYFESEAGLDDSQDNTAGSVVFSVYGDGKLKYRSPVTRWDTETHQITLNIKGIDELLIIVDDAGDGDSCDHACWADAAVY